MVDSPDHPFPPSRTPGLRRRAPRSASRGGSRRSALSAALAILLLTLGAVLPACSPGVAIMMPPPLILHDVGSPLERTAPEHRVTVVPVYYATNRTPEPDASTGPSYSCQITPTVRLGLASVQLGPQGGAWSDLAHDLLRGERPPTRVARMDELGSLAESDAFAQSLNTALAGCHRKDIFVYIPGINSTFESAILRMADLSFFMDREGVFVAFGWPAHAHPFAYDADRRAAIDSVDAFTAFVAFLQRNTQAQRIHLITSSAGAPLVTGLLRSALPPDDPAAPPGAARVGQVVYAASDQDIDDFKDMLDSGADRRAEHITIYASRTDLGLVLTRHFGSGDRTIGLLPANLTDTTRALLLAHADRVTVVDATDAVHLAGRGDLWAHSYWYLNPWVSSDLLAVLHHALPPARRALVPSEDGAVWSFPADYPERLHAVLAAHLQPPAPAASAMRAENAPAPGARRPGVTDTR